MNIDHEVFAYILIPDEGGNIPHQRFIQLIDSISNHSQKHDFANMVIKSRICIRTFKIKDENLVAIYLPFQRETFNDQTTLNWYVKTQAAKHGFKVVQMILPNGELLDS